MGGKSSTNILPPTYSVLDYINTKKGMCSLQEIKKYFKAGKSLYVDSLIEDELWELRKGGYIETTVTTVKPESLAKKILSLFSGKTDRFYYLTEKGKKKIE